MNLNEKRNQIINFLGINPAIIGTGIVIANLEGDSTNQYDHCEMVEDVLEEYSNVTFYKPIMKNGLSYTSQKRTGQNDDYDNFEEFIDKCIDNKIDIIACSKDCKIDSLRLKYVEKAYNNGIIFTVAAGNDDEEVTESYLGDLKKSPYVVTVGSYYLDENNKMNWGNHNYGKIDALAPTYIPIDYEEDGKLDENPNGTSFSQPMLAILIAESKRLNNKINSKTIKELIRYISLKFESKRGTYDYFTLSDDNIAKIKNFKNSKEIPKEKEVIKMLTPYKNGYRISQHYSEQHTGVDLVGVDKFIYSISAGVVDYCGWESYKDHSQGFGQYIRIKGDDGLYYYYGHLNWIHEDIKIGKKVDIGTILGLEGSTGKSTGSHLHLEIRKKTGVITDMFNSVNVEKLLTNDLTIKEDDLTNSLKKIKKLLESNNIDFNYEWWKQQWNMETNKFNDSVTQYIDEILIKIASCI